MLAIDGDRKATPLATTGADELQGVVSPDGRWLAFQSNESGRYEVYVQAFPTANERWQVSSDGGGRPRWRTGSTELFYLSNRGMMAVGYRVSANQFSAQKPALILEGTFVDYDVAPGSQRFVVVRPDPVAKPVAVQVVVNWFEELRRRVATAPR
jgi:serine/threonine-protein kinase